MLPTPPSGRSIAAAEPSPVLDVAAILVAAPFALVIDRVILRFMYTKDEVVILLDTYALILILEDVVKLIWGVNPYFMKFAV